jgi:hypothetical protein
VGQRKTTTKAGDQAKRDQVPQGWRHIHTASDLNCVKGAQRKRPDPPGDRRDGSANFDDANYTIGRNV